LESCYSWMCLEASEHRVNSVVDSKLRSVCMKFCRASTSWSCNIVEWERCCLPRIGDLASTWRRHCCQSCVPVSFTPHQTILQVSDDADGGHVLTWLYMRSSSTLYIVQQHLPCSKGIVKFKKSVQNSNHWTTTVARADSLHH